MISKAVDYMTTKPTHKGKGVASMMLENALKQVDAAGLKAIVMATPAGLRLYEKHGFVIVQTLVQDFSKYGTEVPYINHFLIREPQKG